MDYKAYIAEKLAVDGVSPEEILESIAVPPDPTLGDYALPCFKFAKILRKSPVAIAEELAKRYETDEIVSSVSAVNGYLNFQVDRAGLFKNFRESFSPLLTEEGEKAWTGYAAREFTKNSDMGAKKTVCIDYSSVNIAKPFHIGHLSTTVIGGALSRIYRFLGYNVVGINHLGDYGTQFGKLISAYKRWGNRADVEAGGIHAINDLYVRFNSEATEEMEAEAREYFRLIENGDREANELFETFKSITLAYVKKIYDRLHVTFDSYCGESFYIDKIPAVIEKLEKKGLLVESRGAKVVDLEEYGMPPFIVLRSDGASLYATRDLAAAFYRKETYDFDKCLYVVAYQQNLHFQQLFRVIERMGEPWAKDLVHVAYGMVSLEDGAMSTRKGKVVWLEDVLSRSVEKAAAILAEKNPDLKDREKVAEQVGVGAVIFGALYNNKIKDIVFSYDKALNFDGETSVYVQYTCARAASVLDKLGGVPFHSGEGAQLNEREFALVKALAEFPDTVRAAAVHYEPSMIARWCMNAAQLFNKFYIDCRIVNAETEELRSLRKTLTHIAFSTLKKGLGLLGIEVPKEM